MVKFAAIQMTSGGSLAANISQAERLASQAVGSGAEFVVFPENFALMPIENVELTRYQESVTSGGPIQTFLSEFSKKHGVWLLGGTLPMASDDENRPYATSLLYNQEGEQVLRYDKIHLFDVKILDSNESYTESNTISRGNHIKVCETPFGKVGVAVCYDLRFPELFRAMADLGAEIILLPAAFTALTGKAHWEVLLRARAIENLNYVVAAAQGGYHVNKRMTYGNSMIIDPWGSIVGIKPDDRPGIVIADIDPTFTHKTRTTFPALTHKRLPL